MSEIFLLLPTYFLRRQTNLVYSEMLTLVRNCLYVTFLHCLIRLHLVLTEQVAGGIVVPGSGRLIACLGVDDLVIVDMPDTLLVTTRARSQEVKRLVKKTREAGWKSLL